ncbi:hypothetical protein BN946_scf184569.g3 [Trametes cinnabarina]|uniref:Uncharacterized protein n=1 Tax=Pycnoporus cinnabarinus TaxID=5643 RepID=A0A060S7W9_PYCCI|nr:hypothetical protein BN946_scf184569.g3 [Trametes cinnabarina]
MPEGHTTSPNSSAVNPIANANSDDGLGDDDSLRRRPGPPRLRSPSQSSPVPVDEVNFHDATDSSSCESEHSSTGSRHSTDRLHRNYIFPPEDLPQSDPEDGASSGDDLWEDSSTSNWSDSDSEGDTGAASDTDLPGSTCDGEPSHPASGKQGRRRRAYWPYPNLTWCILDIILNLPRHPISDELLKIFLWALKKLGVKNVPSVKVLRKFQAKLRGTSVFKKELPHVSILGNHFVSNSILKSIALDMANPEVRRYLAFYPEEPVNGNSELRHSWKWYSGLPDHKLTPMWAHRGVHFYIGELAALDNGEVVIPLRWFMSIGKMHMFFYRTRCVKHAGPVEQVSAITEELRSVEETGFLCHDALVAAGVGECLTIPSLFVETGDGPWQSELSSHAGDSKPCRFCDVGGTVKERSSDDGFLAIMRPGIQRTPAGTRELIQRDLEMAVKPRKGAEIERNQQGSGVVDSLARTVIDELVQRGKALFDEKDTAGKRVNSNVGIEAALVAMRAERIQDHDFMNPLLSDPDFDPHLDTAIGRLHLVLLGFTKYFWSASLPIGGGKKLSVKEKEVLEVAAATLFSLSQHGIGDRSLRPEYVMHFRGSLVGRHLHSIAQIAVFMFARIVEPVLHAVWVSLSRLCALLFVQVIRDMKSHQVRAVLDKTTLGVMY